MPLTEEQKGSMSERDILNWESAAKVGLLRGDPTLTRMLDSVRSVFSNPVAITDSTAEFDLAEIMGKTYKFGSNVDVTFSSNKSDYYTDGVFDAENRQDNSFGIGS